MILVLTFDVSVSGVLVVFFALYWNTTFNLISVYSGSTMTGVTDAIVNDFFKSATICFFAPAVILPKVGTIEIYTLP